MSPSLFPVILHLPCLPADSNVTPEPRASPDGVKCLLCHPADRAVALAILLASSHYFRQFLTVGRFIRSFPSFIFPACHSKRGYCAYDCLVFCVRMSQVSAVQHAELSPEYWSKRWEAGQTFWHQKNVNEDLAAHLGALDAVKAAVPAERRPRIFVPLCGATVDMAYLINQGWHVIGLDAVEQPLRSFVTEHQSNLVNLRDVATPVGVHIAADHLDLFGIDLFSADCTPALFGGAVDCVWDRGSFVAIGVEQREAYIAKLLELYSKSHKPNYLLNAVEYNTDSAFVAPPHTLPRAVIEEHVKAHSSNFLLLEQRDSLSRFPNVTGLTRFNVSTYAITISK